MRETRSGGEPRHGADRGEAETSDAPEERRPDGAADAEEDVDAAARLALERAREGARAKGLRRTSFLRRRRSAGADGAPGDGAGESGGWRPPPGVATGGSGPGPSRRDPQPLGGIAARLVAERGWTRSIGVGGVVGRWREVVGDQVADHCEVETFTDGELVVRASSTAWATQVRLLLPQLERRLAEEVGEGMVTSIVVLGPGGPSWKHGSRVVRGRGPRDTYG